MVKHTDRQRRHECTQARKKRRRKIPSHVFAQPAQPCSPAARASHPSVFVWLSGGRPAVLGRACGNTCETAIIMAFCLRVGVEVAGVFPPRFTCRGRKLCAVMIFSRSLSAAVSYSPVVLTPSFFRPVCVCVVLGDRRPRCHPPIIPFYSPFRRRCKLINIAAVWQFVIEWAATIIQMRRRGASRPSIPVVCCSSAGPWPSPALRLV